MLCSLGLELQMVEWLMIHQYQQAIKSYNKIKECFAR